MKKWVGYVLLAIAVVVAYQGYVNAQNGPLTQDLARSGACDVDSQCVLKGDDPQVVRTDVFQRRYEWRSTVGPIVSQCRRSLIFLGSWSCASEKGSLAGRI
jgi:hypothetical protein